MSSDRNDAFRSAHRFATNWAALLLVVLGLLAIVGVVPGFIAVDDLAGAVKVFVQVDITVAMAAMFMAAVLAGSAAGMTAAADEPRVDLINRHLHWSIVFAVLGALAITTAVFSVAFTEKKEHPPTLPASLIVLVDGKAYCGPLVLASDGSVSVRGFPVHQATSVMMVSGCPTYDIR